MPMTYLAVEFPSQCLTCRPYSCMSWPTNTDRMLLLFTRASWDPSPVCQGGQSLIQQRRAHRASNSFWTTYSGSQFNVIIPSLILSLRHQDQNKLHSRSCLLTSSALAPLLNTHWQSHKSKLVNQNWVNDVTWYDLPTTSKQQPTTQQIRTNETDCQQQHSPFNLPAVMSA